MIPIFIPSRHRATTCKFCYDIKNTNRDYYIFIRSDDLEEYKKYFPIDNLVILSNDVDNISKTRQFILNTARELKLEWFWMVDDDIHTYYRKPLNYDGKLEKISLEEFLKDGEKIIKNIQIEDKIFQIGFKQSAFCLTSKPYTINTDIGGITIFNSNNIEIDYDPNMIALEDTDFIVRNIKNGSNNIKLNNLIFYMPKSGSSKGGLEDIYKNNGKEIGIRQFKKKYPELISIASKDKYRIKWNNFKKNIYFEI